MPDLWELLSILAKFLMYFGVLGSVGLVLVRLVFRRETGAVHRRICGQASALALLALAAAGFGFLLRGAAMTGDASGMTDPEMLGLLWRNPPGNRLVLLGSGLLLVLAGLRAPRIGLWIAGAGGLLALWSFARIGHIPDAGPLLLQALLVLHLAAAAFWIGILSPLRRLAAQPEELSAAAELGYRFGRIAAVTVPVLVAAGIVMAWRLLGDVSALATTGYGLTLLAKIAGVAVLLGAAAYNRLRFVPAMRRGEPAAAARLRRAIAVEWLAVCAILLVTATLTTIQHPAG
ncbi:MAG: copper-binding protein [Rhodospirillaceae bacterium]|nr:copper-binding protein [Rhodospirillaceae bacterium]MYH36473.1 copper-binding protein [Rhodospirillaceae bacterium]MYK13324.1 copper-binding protein [Rhodospirillaceae bacterium]